MSNMNDGETETYLLYFHFFDLLVHHFEKTSSKACSLLLQPQYVGLFCKAEIVTDVENKGTAAKEGVGVG